MVAAVNGVGTGNVSSIRVQGNEMLMIDDICSQVVCGIVFM